MPRLSFLILLAVLVPALAHADLVIPPATYPSIAATAPGAAGFVPAGWRVETTANGDLNGDGLVDLAMILRATSRRNIIANPEGLGEDPFDTNPRILVVAFKQTGGTYRLILANHGLIPRRDNPAQSDFLEDDALRIQRGTLRITLHDFMSAGGWGMGSRTFVFRHQFEQFQLIGFDSTETQRNSGERTTTSINYSTRRATIATGNIESDAERTRTVTLPQRPLLTLVQIGNGMEFEPALR